MLKGISMRYNREIAICTTKKSYPIRRGYLVAYSNFYRHVLCQYALVTACGRTHHFLESVEMGRHPAPLGFAAAWREEGGIRKLLLLLTYGTRVHRPFVAAATGHGAYDGW